MTAASVDSQTIPVIDLPTEETPTEGTDDDDDHRKDKGDKKHRMPSRPVNCIISTEGVSLEGDTSAIDSFKIRDMDGNTSGDDLPYLQHRASGADLQIPSRLDNYARAEIYQHYNALKKIYYPIHKKP